MLRNVTNDSQFFSVMRPSCSAQPSTPLPFYPRSLGRFQLAAGVEEEVPVGEKMFVQFFWVENGRGEFRWNGRWHTVGQGDCFFHLPGEEHLHRVLDSHWEYRWLAFDGKHAGDFMESYEYPRDGFHGGSCPAERFLELEKRLLVRSPFAWREMISIITRILAAAGGGDTAPETDLAAAAADLCRKNFADPEFNINRLSELLGVERSTLLRHFKAGMRLSPSAYLQEQRILHAISLLKESRLSMECVARRCGFSNAAYFCRCIRRTTGMKPSLCRKN